MSQATFTESPDQPVTIEPQHWVVSELVARVGAAFIDGFLIFWAWAVATLLYQGVAGLLGAVGVGGLPDHGSLDMGIGMYAMGVLYLGLTESRRGPRSGQTCGKQIAGIRTVTASGGMPPGYARSWTRALILASLLPLGLPLFAFVETANLAGIADRDIGVVVNCVVLLAGLTAAAATSRRTFFDVLLGTTVVKQHIVAPCADDPDATQRSLVPLEVRGIPRHGRTMLTMGFWLVAVPWFTYVDRI